MCYTTVYRGLSSLTLTYPTLDHCITYIYSIFSELPVVSNTVVIITVCVKVANSTFLVTNKRTKWAKVSRYYLCMLFCKGIFDY